MHPREGIVKVMNHTFFGFFSLHLLLLLMYAERVMGRHFVFIKYC